MNVRKKPRRQKKNSKQKKKLKIGRKLQKNLDKNKFGLDKKKSYYSDKKVYCLSIKKYCLSTKKGVEWRGKNRTPPDTTIHLHHLIPHTQHNITKKDVVQKTTSPPANLFYTLTT